MTRVPMKELRKGIKTKIIAVYSSNGYWRQISRDENIPQATAYRLMAEVVINKRQWFKIQKGVRIQRFHDYFHRE